MEEDRLQVRGKDRLQVRGEDKDGDRASEVEGVAAEVEVSVWGQAENATAPTVNTVNPINRESHATPGSALNVAHS